MTDVERLENAIQELGLKKSSIASRMGIAESSLRNKMNCKTEFLPSEIQSLVKILQLSNDDVMEIFFKKSVDK